MADRYRDLVNSAVGRRAAPKLGLPHPVVLRRFDAAGPLLPGRARFVELGHSALGAAVTEALISSGAELTQPTDAPEADPTRLGAIVLDATGADTVDALAALPERLPPDLRRLLPSARVVVVGTRPDVADEPGSVAARQALEGIVRSLAKELRAGATANLVQVDPAAPPAAAAMESTLRFLLSGRSAYVNGQVLALGSTPAPAPGDWSAPLAGRIALVTGAARGIGAAIAETLARDGAHVVSADLPGAGEALAEVANRVGGTTLQLDIAAPDAPAYLAHYLTSRHGGVDVVVHNAGITRDKLLANMRLDAWSAVLDVNLGAQLRMNETLLSHGTLHPGARIVCLSSTSGIAGNRGQTNYSASKAGIIGMVRATAPRLRALDATVNAVAPGFIDTEMTARMPFATREVARRLNSLHQAGLPVDVAEAVAWLASSGAGAVTGQVLRVCGQNLVGA